LSLLLDSNALLRALFEPDRLSKAAAKAIDDPLMLVFVSAVSPYELEWKRGKGQLKFEAVRDWPSVMAAAGYEPLPVTIDHAQRAARLPRIHRDPWDRMLIAQADAEGLTLVTSDGVLSDYGVPVLW
jgi:PIN domain nuclease of toxin-antitoxin system